MPGSAPTPFSRPALGLAILGATTLAGPMRAHAYEDQVGLAVSAGYSLLASGSPRDPSPEARGLPQHGLALGVTGSLGLGDTWEVRLLASWAAQLGDTSLHRVSGGAELVYLIDILEVVPFLGLGVDVPTSIHLRSDATSVWVDFAGHAVVGVDWLPARDWAIGVEIRPYVLFTALGTDPVWLTASARVQWLFEI